MKLDRTLSPLPTGLPDWVPLPVAEYLVHTAGGMSIRSVARAQGHHASTVLRHVRHLENRRDDLLVDEALQYLTSQFFNVLTINQGDSPYMTVNLPHSMPITEKMLTAEALRVLRRLAESSSFLIIAGDLDKAVVVRESSAGHPIRTAIVERRIAQAFALKDWIECIRKGKIAQYQITVSGRAALKRLIAEQLKPEPMNGMAEAPNPFREQHGEWEMREFRDSPKSVPQKLRYNLAESPLTALGRRAGKDGKPFLSTDLVATGERLREDFELAQMGARVTQNWDRFLTSGRSGDFGNDGPAEGPRAARERVAAALKDLGPGLGDIVLRCCCFLEGLETAEKRMGWSARSGKIVLRIALQRLRLHYEQRHGNLKPMIG
jgi:hypothetical protein